MSGNVNNVDPANLLERQKAEVIGRRASRDQIKPAQSPESGLKPEQLKLSVTDAGPGASDPAAVGGKSPVEKKMD